MATNNEMILKEMSIRDLFYESNTVYQIPIYQRNYAWEKDEIEALVRDTYDAFTDSSEKVYYIGTLVTYYRNDGLYEVIDGQQRLTTIRLILSALDKDDDVVKKTLRYSARDRSNKTLSGIKASNELEETDEGLVRGYKYAMSAIGDVLDVKKDDFDKRKAEYVDFFLNKVHIVRYRVPRDIDLNHYFEIMNSRGEQLEKHEIVKADLMKRLTTSEERIVFNQIWDCASQMNVYLQQNYAYPVEAFSYELSGFNPTDFSDLKKNYLEDEKKKQDEGITISIADILKNEVKYEDKRKKSKDRKDSFQPIIDFPNFLLIVLKITLMDKDSFNPALFILDDKELLREFKNADLSADEVKRFAYNLFKARFLLDNYIVHHSNEDDTIDNNPWKLQVWHRDESTKKGQLRNLTDDKDLQDELVHLLSMFEVSFTPRQRKNYLFYCLIYLMNSSDIRKPDNKSLVNYREFVRKLARKYFFDVYMDKSKLNAINTPVPGGFDESIIQRKSIFVDEVKSRNKEDFYNIYGNGDEASVGVPLFVFNYLDYLLWMKYAREIRGKGSSATTCERDQFFFGLGCKDFGLNLFNQFYFSRTRRSLEHYYPQASVTRENAELDENQINCLGNYAMIGSEANSTGSNWDPITKITHYLGDASGKIDKISVASLKFMIMMQICKENNKWTFSEITAHQEKMVDILLKG